MTTLSRLARTAAAVVTLSAAGGAFAEGTFVPELGFGQTSGKHVIEFDGSSSHDLAFAAAFGYEMDNGWGVRAMAIGDFDIQSDFGLGHLRTFDNFVGVQATGKIPLASTLALRGGLGIGRSNLVGDGHELTTDGIVSAGLQWRPVPHYAMELHYDRLTTTGTNFYSLQFQVPF